MWLSVLIQNLISTGDYKRECVFFGLHRGYSVLNILILRHPKFVIGKLVLVVFLDQTINWYIYLVSYIKYILFMLVMQYTMVPNLRKKEECVEIVLLFYIVSCKETIFYCFFFPFLLDSCTLLCHSELKWSLCNPVSGDPSCTMTSLRKKRNWFLYFFLLVYLAMRILGAICFFCFSFQR